MTWRVHFGPVPFGVLDAKRTRALSNHRRFDVLLRADEHLRKEAAPQLSRVGKPACRCRFFPPDVTA
jgi:hypothetical protein